MRYALVSVPVYLAPMIGGDLCQRAQQAVMTNETPNRTYFLVPLLLLWNGGPLYLRPDVHIEMFSTIADAVSWNERDAKAWAVVQ